jgi:hypothetical protein
MHRPTRPRARLALAALLLAAAPAAAAAQARPDSARADSAARGDADSLAARLARAEAAIELLRRQLGEVAEGATRTRSRARLDLYATVLTNAFYTSGRANVADVPQIALPPAATPPPRGVLGATVRQSRVGAAASVGDVLGAEFDAVIDVDFFGGVPGGPRRPPALPRAAAARGARAARVGAHRAAGGLRDAARLRPRPGERGGGGHPETSRAPATCGTGCRRCA